MSTLRIKLTKTFVDSILLQLDGKQAIYRDSDLICFALRVMLIKVYLAERRIVALKNDKEIGDKINKIISKPAEFCCSAGSEKCVDRLSQLICQMPFEMDSSAYLKHVSKANS